MSTHILSDIEALCQEVAILSRGKLKAAGRLDELLQAHSDLSLEVTVKGVEAGLIADQMELIAGASIKAKPDGAVIEIAGEEDLDAVLTVSRSHGGRLVSVEPIRKSLEDLFEH